MNIAQRYVGMARGRPHSRNVADLSANRPAGRTPGGLNWANRKTHRMSAKSWVAQSNWYLVRHQAVQHREQEAREDGVMAQKRLVASRKFLRRSLRTR